MREINETFFISGNCVYAIEKAKVTLPFKSPLKPITIEPYWVCVLADYHVNKKGQIIEKKSNQVVFDIHIISKKNHNVLIDTWFFYSQEEAFHYVTQSDAIIELDKTLDDDE